MNEQTEPLVPILESRLIEIEAEWLGPDAWRFSNRIPRDINTVEELILAVRAERSAFAAERRELVGFANDILEWRNGTVDGCDIEEVALKHGLLRGVEVSEPCDERNCTCAYMGNIPGVCYRKTELLGGASSKSCAAQGESMRNLTDHIVEGDQADQLQIEVTDEPGQGGANHDYEIRKPHGHGADFPLLAEISFQNGPIKESGINGVTQEALAAIIIDRLRSFQAGPFACQANEDALNCFSKGLHHLQTRTRDRIARGVEGQNIK